MPDPATAPPIHHDLSKWPRLLVVGQPITSAQADEILVRTDAWHLMVNDREWTRAVCEVAGIRVNDRAMLEWRSVAAFRARVRALDLHYLHNEQIASAWVGGPHGWCDWRGGIGCTTWNIGKWPSHAEVLGDWKRIAAAFPHLDLTAQLVPDEGAAGWPAVTYRVRRGEAVEVEPAGFITSPQELSPEAVLSVLVRGRERGVDLERLREAVERCRRAR